ncbi:hypothetical protein PX554_24795 [Sphingomonas sp. H39-1-10]|uniref:hypothetical protein n=1 Tax=Sphingomonas pollutisoli TaxID=3030829 RepID=UPI0023B9F1FE|nr:hypothetical protein [Sphingomonas pollutisoli]MDF0491338.1 hypothetical protein [Sphingomonas pollutisoli]
MLPDGFTATERQVLAEAVVESATGERRILVVSSRQIASRINARIADGPDGMYGAGIRTAANAIVGRVSRDMPLLIDPFAIGEWLDEHAPFHALVPACCEEGYFLKPSDERWSTGASLDE